MNENELKRAKIIQNREKMNAETGNSLRTLIKDNFSFRLNLFIELNLLRVFAAA